MILESVYIFLNQSTGQKREYSDPSYSSTSNHRGNKAFLSRPLEIINVQKRVYSHFQVQFLHYPQHSIVSVEGIQFSEDVEEFVFKVLEQERSWIKRKEN